MGVISNRHTVFLEKNAWHDISFGNDHVHRLMKKTLLNKFIYIREWLWGLLIVPVPTRQSMHRTRLKQLVGILALWLSWSTAWAQFDSLVQQADRLLSYKAYGRAIEAYTQLLTEPTNKLTPVQKVTVQSQLAYAYRQVGNGAKAEQLYRESVDSGLNEPQQTLNFAQTLASNGKFQESQRQYELYLQQKDKVTAQRIPAGPVPATGPAGGQRASDRYRLEYLAINSSGEEFSPAFYQDGLVYVSGSKGGSAIKTLGRGGNSSVLDLFYVPNRDGLKATTIIGADGTSKKVSANRATGGRQVGADERSRPTANDSPTLSGSGRSSAGAPRQLSDALNSRYHEGPVTFSPDGSRIIFTRNNYKEGRARRNAGRTTTLKLYTARRENGVWVDVTGLPFNNDDYSVGHPTLSRDEQLLYFVSDMPGGYGGTDLYVSRYQNGSWGRPVNLGEDINTTGNELFPFVDDAGNLYFSTNGRKGLGELDIYFATVTTLNTGFVVQSVDHLNAPINSPGDDFGLITNNRLGGYFSSNRRDGNDDIYRFTREETPDACRDLTIQLYDGNSNAPLDSTRIVVKAKTGGRPDKVMTTDRNGFARLCLDRNNDFTLEASRDGYTASMVGFTTRSLTDNQSTQIQMSLMKLTKRDTVLAGSEATVGPAAVVRSRLRGVVVGERDGRPIEGVTVRLRNECNGNRLRYVTGRDGRYEFDIIAGCNYTLVAAKPSFGTNENKIKRLPKKSKSNVLSADLRMLGVGDVMLIDNIYHDPDRSSLRPDAARELEKLVATMRKYPSLIVEIRSHTDSRGNADVNKALSAQRARSIADYLATKGISRRRMTTIGMGESRLLNNCTDDVICTEAEHQRNRRTEFRVVDIK